jgi:hypothetical protein
MRRFFYFCLALLFFGQVSPSLAAPFNDDYQLAYPLRTGLNFISVSNDSATIQVGEPAFSATKRSAKSVWYRYTPPVDGFVTLFARDDGCCGFNRGVAIDVFKGTTFAAVNRLGVATAEDGYFGNSGYVQYVRLTIPTRKNQPLKIRVGSTQDANYDSVFIGLNILQSGPTGAVHVLELKETSWSRQPRIIWANSNSTFSSNFNFPGAYLFLNATTTAGVPTLSSTIPTSTFSVSSGTLPARIQTKPGVVFGSFDSLGNPLLNRIGIWDYTITAKVNSAGRVVANVMPVKLARIDDSRAAITVSMVEGDRSVVFGKNARFEAWVENTSAFLATRCYVTNLFGSYGGTDPAGVLAWSAGTGARYAPFSVPAGGRIKVTGTFLSDTIGNSVGYWLTFGVFCQNAEWESHYLPNARLTVTPY